MTCQEVPAGAYMTYKEQRSIKWMHGCTNTSHISAHILLHAMQSDCHRFDCLNDKTQFWLLLVLVRELFGARARFLCEEMRDARIGSTAGGRGHFTCKSMLPEFTKPRISFIREWAQGKVVRIEFVHVRTVNAYGY